MDFSVVLAVSIINISLGLFVLLQIPRLIYGRMFFYMTLFIVLWAVSSYVTEQPSLGLATNSFANQLSYLTGFLVVTTGLLFTYGFPYQRRVSNAEKLVVTVLVIAALGLSLTPLVAGNVIATGNNLTYTLGSLVWFYILAFLAIVILIIRNLLKPSQRLNRKAMAQSRLVMAAFVVSAVVGLGANLLLPVISDKWSSTQFGPLATVVLVAVIAYTIARHGLFDIRSAVIRTAGYILTLGVLGLIYYFLAALTSQLFFSGETSKGVSANPANIALALILAFIFQPIKKFFDKITNFLFFRNSYNSNDFFARLTRRLSRITDLETLLNYSINEVSQTLKASFGAFWVYRKDNQPYYVSTTNRHWMIPERDVKTLESYFAESQHKVLIVNSLDTNNPNARAVYRLLTSHRIALVLSLFRVQDNKVIGYLFLGDHLSSQYTNTDIRALKTIADELTIALENALSLQEVRDLNATLQQRIDNATRELRLSNTQLQRLDEVKDEFMSMASHQLRTPLTTVKGYISMVLEGDAGKVSPAQKKLLGEAFASSERMVRLIGDFLNVSRLQTGKFIIEKQPTNLAKVVSEEIEGLAPNAAARGLKFHYRQPSRFPVLNLDETKIRQVIMNFSDNAIYYSKDGGSIDITLKVDRSDVIFMVKDRGIGVPADQQPQLFQKFFRATNARKQRPDGTGVGLFLAKRVIDGHGGKIIFESKEDKGSTFGFSLPIAKLKIADKK